MSSPQPIQEDIVTMPRRLAVRLMHAAQLAPERAFRALVVSDSPSDLPDAMLPLDEDLDTDMAREGLLSKGRYPWALYWHRPGHTEAPAAEDFELGPDSLCLSSSLATKGVLQLHGWRCDQNGHVHAVTVRMKD
ncbi:MAG: hypothetical protein L0H29_01330 [Sinobacteraceae bacterium]|nr:hypothetical protein [Nevskiaceae bacterium]